MTGMDESLSFFWGGHPRPYEVSGDSTTRPTSVSAIVIGIVPKQDWLSIRGCVLFNTTLMVYTVYAYMGGSFSFRQMQQVKYKQHLSF